MRRQRQAEVKEFEERVVRVDRTRKTVAGGRISSARVVVAVGDVRGRVGVGVGKARDVPSAIEKGVKAATKAMIRIPLDGYTIPHVIKGKSGGAIILLKPASRGTGIIAGGAVRQIMEVSGVRDILTKSLGSGNVFNRAMACFEALKSLYDPQTVAENRGTSVEEMLGRTIEDPYKLEDEAAAAKAEAAVAEQEPVDFERALVGPGAEQVELEEAETEEPEPEAGEPEAAEQVAASDEEAAEEPVEEAKEPTEEAIEAAADAPAEAEPEAAGDEAQA